MPNWTKNTVEIEGSKEDLDALIATCVTDGALDFAKIVPYPEGFDPTLPSGSDDSAYLAYYNPAGLARMLDWPWVKAEGITTLDALVAMLERRYAARVQAAQVHDRDDNTEQYHRYPTLRQLGDAYRKNIDVGGCATWYEWNNEHWGTKWTACDCDTTRVSDTNLRFVFNTAWCEPLPVFEALHEKFPRTLLKYHADHEGDDTITGKKWYPEYEEENTDGP